MRVSPVSVLMQQPPPGPRVTGTFDCAQVFDWPEAWSLKAPGVGSYHGLIPRDPLAGRRLCRPGADPDLSEQKRAAGDPAVALLELAGGDGVHIEAAPRNERGNARIARGDDRVLLK